MKYLSIICLSGTAAATSSSQAILQSIPLSELILSQFEISGLFSRDWTGKFLGRTVQYNAIAVNILPLTCSGHLLNAVQQTLISELRMRRCPATKTLTRPFLFSRCKLVKSAIKVVVVCKLFTMDVRLLSWSVLNLPVQTHCGYWTTLQCCSGLSHSFHGVVMFKY